MTWKPTDEMTAKIADLSCTAALCCEDCGKAAITHVQPLIAEEARAKALNEAADYVQSSWKDGKFIALGIRALKPPEEGP